MRNVRNLCNQWATKTYEEGLADLHLTDKKLEKQSRDLFERLGILCLPMDGYSCEKLPKTEESRTGIKKTYSEIFHDEYSKDFFSPASYLVQLIIECNNYPSDDSKIIGALARGLRTLTSLLREPDFAYQLEITLLPNDSNVCTSLNSKQDSSDHTDVLLNYQNISYRIWLYQFSSRGLPHDIERLTGKRGELPKGIHIICPLHTEVAIKYDKLSKRVANLKEKLTDYQQKLNECSERAVKKKEALEEQIQKYHSRINDALPVLNKEYEHSVAELDIVNGWYFYSNAYIQRVAKYLNTLSPMNYSDVVDLLSAPERFVGSLQSFNKGE